MDTSFVTIAIPFQTDANIEAQLQPFGNLHRPAAEARADQLRQALDSTGIVHFLSVNVLRDAGDAQGWLIIEAAADGAVPDAIDALGPLLTGNMPEVLAAVGAPADVKALRDFLAAHNHVISPAWFSSLGLSFNGTPGMSVHRIRAEAELVKKIVPMLKMGPTALETLETVRTRLWNEEGEKWAFIPEAIRWLSAKRWSAWTTIPFALAKLAWPFLLAALALVGILTAILDQWFSIWVSFMIASGATAFGAVAALGFVFWRFRRDERRSLAVDITPARAAVEALMRQENFAAQNHLFGVSTLKTGRIRLLALRLAFALIGELAARHDRVGHLGDIGTIHIARWLCLPGTDKLLFLSNYDGSWENYLEDFIEKTSDGLTGIWSNTAEFPKTNYLFKDGAKDGDRFKRWARRQQFPTLVWYSAYPQLTTARIRSNAVIRQGLACARTESEASDWLTCFGSAPRPAAALQTTEIPTLLFGGLSPLKSGAALLIRFESDARPWLRHIAPRLSYGDKISPDKVAVVAAFSADGLSKLGLTDKELATFSPAFQDGMDKPWRARSLGDAGDSAPERWTWGNNDNPVDAILLLYAADRGELELLLQQHREALREHTIAARVIFQEVEKQQDLTSTSTDKPIGRGRNVDLHREAFDFADGISQPIVQGTKRWIKMRDKHHLVAPGELILGYPDNRGFIPPSPSVSAAEDPTHNLPALSLPPDQERPDFTNLQPLNDRDFGRNGTFLVVRQLEQDVDEFNKFVDEATQHLDGRLLGLAPHEEADWIKAKLIGRWPDGTSLVRYPNASGTSGGRSARPDNDFLFGTEDPDGRRCPLGAHIRRVNPRDSFAPGSLQQVAITNRHRILRVGRSYSEKDNENLTKPGLFFMCLNADIERQFEFVQQSWASASNFHGLDNEVDCFSIRGESEGMTIPTAAGPLCLKRLSDFVTVLGGAYFFMPGRRAVQYLAAQPAKPPPAAKCPVAHEMAALAPVASN